MKTATLPIAIVVGAALMIMAGCATHFRGELPLKDGRLMKIDYSYPIWTKKSLAFDINPETGKVQGTVESSETSLAGTLDSLSGVIDKAVASAVEAGIKGAAAAK